jgi:hypothetical protein
MNLVFGQRKYQDFSEQEKFLVDTYQESVFQESCGCVVLPNTYMNLEQREYELLLTEKKQ